MDISIISAIPWQFRSPGCISSPWIYPAIYALYVLLKVDFSPVLLPGRLHSISQSRRRNVL